jgi:steroid delta-isomerase-like uncharacterized protein
MAETKTKSTASGSGAKAKKPARPRRSARVKAVEETARSYFRAVSDRDPAAMAAHWDPEGVGDLVPLGLVLRGPEAVRDFFTGLFGAFPDMEFRVEAVSADNQGATVQWRAGGRFTGTPFQGIEPTGRTVEVRGCDCLEIDKEGKLTRNTAYYDGAAFARSIGMLPPQDSGADRAMVAGFNAYTKARRAVADLTGSGR